MGTLLTGEKPIARVVLGDAEASKAYAGAEPLWTGNRFRVSIRESNSSTEVTVNGVPVQSMDTVPYGAHVKIMLFYTLTSNLTFSVRSGGVAQPLYSDAACTVRKTGTAAGRYYFVMPAGNVLISSSSTAPTCIPSGTMITMADGTRKPVEDVTAEDRVLAFDHETGEPEAAGIIFMEADGVREWPVLRLTFSDGSGTGLIYEHGYFDLDLMRYVYIREDNCGEFIGHRFAKVSAEGEITPAVLTDARVAPERTGCFSFPSVYHLNFLADGLLSMPGGITGMFNIFDYGGDLKYDAAAKAADVARYGLLGYRDFEDYMTFEEYSMYPAPYLGAALGKGVMTREQLEYLIERYVIEKR